MTVLTEGNHAGEFIVSEESIDYRNVETIGISGLIKAGTVLGVKLNTPAVSAPGASNIGNGVMGAVVVGGTAKIGTYILTMTSESANAGGFAVEYPDGTAVGVGTVAVEFASGGLTFTLADGAEDFDIGDVFTITVSGEYLPLEIAAVDGTQYAQGILFDNIDTTSASDEAVILNKDCVVNGAEIVLPVDITDAETSVVVQQLANIGVIVKGA